MPGNFNAPQIDFAGPLNTIGNNIKSNLDQSRIESALANFNGNYQDAASALMRMGFVDEATKLYTAGALGDYRAALGQAAGGKASAAEQKSIPPALQLWNAYKNGDFNLPSTQPSRLGPPDTSGIDAGVAAADAEAAGTAPPPTPTPGISLQNAPGAVQSQLLPVQEYTKLRAMGQGEGQRQSMFQGLKEQSPGAQKLINNLSKIATNADPDTFQNALGPYQGGDQPDTIAGALGQQGAQTLGSVANYFDQGLKGGFVDWKTGHIKSPGELPGGRTSTLRTNIAATSASLVNLFQRFLRVQGIGSQSDKELRQLMDQANDLTKSADQADFQDRLGNLVTNMNALGFNVQMPSGGSPQAQPAKAQDRFANGPTEASAVTPDGQVSPNINVPEVPGATNGPVLQGPGAAPPKPPVKAINALKAYRNNPQARAAFDEIYGPGAAEFYLNRQR